MAGKTDPDGKPLAQRDRFADLLDDSLSVEAMDKALRDKGIEVLAESVAAGGSKMAGQGLSAEPQSQIDLHGLTIDEAIQKTLHYLQNCRHRGLRQVLVITGRGLHSEAGAVLPDAIETFLEELKLKDEIVSYQWYRGVKGESGALNVAL